jgi:phage N-6-adenine-methyltransferase
MSHGHFADSDVGPQWATPSEIWEPLADAVGGFDLDPAAGCEPSPIAEDRYTPEEDGLKQPWYGNVWLNPPYGREHNRAWAEKTLAESRRDDVDTILALVPASTATNWWQENYAKAGLFCFLDGRVTFLEGGEDSEHNATFASVIVHFGPFKDLLIPLRQMGVVLR